jgi:serine/threonine protein kinase
MEKIREYRIIEKIGEGGMGEVYLAEDENLGRQVAIKMLAPELMRNAELVERFKQEARLQASLIHPNIVALHTFFVENGTFYMVMEYAKGETLSQRLRRVGLLPPHICIPIFIQILNAVGFAHSRGIIHRDLKPSNIIIDQNNNVKVMDFGIAKLFGDKGVTKTGTKMGTVNYMSPEQIMGEKDIDSRTDIFSLGITFYEMLTGKLPYNTNTESDFMLMQQIVESKIPSVKESYPYVPDKVDTAIAIATQKSRGDRFKSCEEFIEFFENDKGNINNVKTLNSNINNNLSREPVNIIDNIYNNIDKDFGNKNNKFDKLDTNKINDEEVAKYRGVKGWLLYLVISLTIFAPIGFIFTLIQEMSNQELALEIYNDYADFVLFRILISFLLTIYSVYVGVILWKVKPNAVKYVKKWIFIQFGILTLLNIISIALMKYIYLEVGLYGIAGSIIGSAIWYAYFEKSKRVKITYMNASYDIIKPKDSDNKIWFIKKEYRVKFFISFVFASIIFNGFYPQYFIRELLSEIWEKAVESKITIIIFDFIVYWLPRLIGSSIVLYYFTKVKWEWIVSGIIAAGIYYSLFLLDVNGLHTIKFGIFLLTMLIQGLFLYRKVSNYYYWFIFIMFIGGVLNIIKLKSVDYSWFIWQDAIIFIMISSFQASLMLFFIKKPEKQTIS